MGWWRENGDLLGDGPADRVSEFLSDAAETGPLTLDSVLAALDQALRRNPAHFVTDPKTVEGLLAAYPSEGPAVWQAPDVAAALVEACQDTLERIAVDFLDNALETLPTCAELLSTFRFVLAPRLPGEVAAPAGFDLRRISYAPGQRALVTDIDLACLEHVLADFGMTRDPDGVPQGDPPEFASWTRHPDLSLEVDWHAPPDGPSHVEIRGDEAPRLTAALIETCKAVAMSDPEEALTELLTVPQREAPAHAPAAEARWAALALAVAGEGVFDDLPARALVSAGLADSDWRTRFVALWAVGHHRMPGLAARAEAAALPKVGYPGLSQDDRRVLLALRALAAARSADRSDTIKPGVDPDFIACIEALIDEPPQIPRTRAEALTLALLRRPFPRGATPPAVQWADWMSAPAS